MSVLQTKRSFARDTLGVVVLALLYAGLGRGLVLLHPSPVHAVPILYAPEGLGLAAVILLGRRLWPGVAIGELLVCSISGDPPGLSIGMALLNGGMAYLGATLFTSFDLRRQLDTMRDAGRYFAMVAALQIFEASAAIGLHVGLWKATLVQAPQLWATWYTSNVIAQFSITPLLLIESAGASARPGWRTVMPAVIVLLVALLSFGVVVPIGPESEVLAFAVFYPLLSYVAVRHGPAGAARSSFVLTVVAAAATTAGLGPFGDGLRYPELNVFLMGLAVTSLLMGALFAERRRAEEQLRLASEVFANTSEGIVVTDPRGVVQRVNPAFVKITGYSEAEVVGQNPRKLQSGVHDAEFYKAMWTTLREKGQWRGEFWNRRKNGEVYPEEMSISAIRNAKGELERYTGIFTDITDRKAAEEHLKRLSSLDGLTGIPNRRTFDQTLEIEWRRATRHGQPLGLAFIDVDHFKRFNDSYGHQQGDECLKAVAKALHAALLRAGDLVARYGGEEFVALLPDTTREQAELVSDKLKTAVESLGIPHEHNASLHRVTVSIGVASLVPPRDSQPADLIQLADRALYRAKAEGRNRVVAA